MLKFHTRSRLTIGFVLSCAGVLAMTGATKGVTVNGTDAIFLAGRSDVVLAPAGTPPAGYPLPRSSPAGPYAETFPELVPVTAPAYQFSVSGSVNYNSLSPDNLYIYGPDGTSSLSAASITALGGISGYVGPRGALLGVFLTDSDPENASAPTTLSFSGAGSTSFSTLSPALNQVFFIGDGLTGTGNGSIQTFVAPAGATRLYLGVPDASNFAGAPGYYDDNTGAFQANVTSVPEPSTLVLVGISGLLLAKR